MRLDVLRFRSEAADNNNCSLNHHYRSYDDDILSVLIGARRASSMLHTHARTYYVNKQNAYCFAICHADWRIVYTLLACEQQQFFFTIIVVTGTRDFIRGKQNRMCVCVCRQSERPMEEKNEIILRRDDASADEHREYSHGSCPVFELGILQQRSCAKKKTFWLNKSTQTQCHMTQFLFLLITL